MTWWKSEGFLMRIPGKIAGFLGFFPWKIYRSFLFSQNTFIIWPFHSNTISGRCSLSSQYLYFQVLFRKIMYTTIIRENQQSQCEISMDHCIITVCPQYIHHLFTIYSLYDHYMFTICALYVLYIFTTCLLYIHFRRNSRMLRFHSPPDLRKLTSCTYISWHDKLHDNTTMSTVGINEMLIYGWAFPSRLSKTPWFL